MRRLTLSRCCLLVLAWLTPSFAVAQIDPYPRELLQFGYNAAFQGHAPLAAYAFYYRNRPHFIRTNLTLRLALAPTYLDSELGIVGALADDTDLAIGAAGGGFADSYAEIARGQFVPKESFEGHGGEVSASIYHCFNPNGRVPLNGVLRFLGHFSTYEANDETATNFTLPGDRGTISIRTGLRWGGKEPLLFPSLAMELSIWYEGQFRTDSGRYGFNDRQVRPHSHLYWGQALLAYTFQNGQNFFVTLTGGGTVNPDRFSAFRLGALLPLVSEFPLSLPGYYYQELSARQFVLLGGNYTVPLDKEKRWNVNINATTAGVNYLRGLEQSGHWHSGAGLGVLYQTPSLKVMVGYAYGIDAIRSSGRGAHSVGVLMQIDLENARGLFNSEPGTWRGFQRIFGAFGD